MELEFYQKSNADHCKVEKWNYKLAHSSFSSLVHSLLPKDNLFKNIFDFTTAGDRDCVVAVERLPALHYSVDFIFLSFGIMFFFRTLKLLAGH